MKREIQISNDLGQVNEMIHDWGTMLPPVFCKKYNYDTDEVSVIIQSLISDRMILTEKAEQENIVGVDNWKEEYAKLYNFL